MRVDRLIIKIKWYQHGWKILFAPLFIFFFIGWWPLANFLQGWFAPSHRPWEYRDTSIFIAVVIVAGITLFLNMKVCTPLEKLFKRRLQSAIDDFEEREFGPIEARQRALQNRWKGSRHFPSFEDRIRSGELVPLEDE